MSSTVGKAMEGRFQKDQNNFTCSIYFLPHPKIVPEPQKMTQNDLKPKNVPQNTIFSDQQCLVICCTRNNED